MADRDLSALESLIDDCIGDVACDGATAGGAAEVIKRAVRDVLAVVRTQPSEHVTVTTGSTSKTWQFDNAWANAERVCHEWNGKYPDSPNVPIQSVFEMLLDVQGRSDLSDLHRNAAREPEPHQESAAPSPATQQENPIVIKNCHFYDSRGEITTQEYVHKAQELGLDVKSTPPPATQPQGWQPIETAPKDGTWVLVTGCNTSPVILVAGYREEKQLWQYPGRWVAYGYVTLATPTHWMSLPAPPPATENK